MNTKALMILGSLVGFVIGAAIGMASGSLGPATFWRSCVAALLLGILTRWWGRIWLGAMRDAATQRQAQQHAATAEAKSTTKV